MKKLAIVLRPILFYEKNFFSNICYFAAFIYYYALNALNVNNISYFKLKPSKNSIQNTFSMQLKIIIRKATY